MPRVLGQKPNSFDFEREASIRALFPLPLAPFEWFMLLDDRPATPLVFCVELVFRGQLDREAFESALAAAVQRHPLLRAQISWTGREPVWTLSDEKSISLRWLESEGDRIEEQILPMDLTQGAGLRVFVRNRSAESTVVCHFHHACCDGLGARRFVFDLLAGYSQILGTEVLVPKSVPLDYELLKRRGEFTAGASMAAVTSAWRKLRDAFHFHVLTPSPLARCKSGAEKGALQPAVHRHVFDRKESAQIQQLVRDFQTRLNDVALASLFMAIAQWNQEHGSANESQRLRILMPMDLRTARDARLPAANRMSFSFLSRRLGQCRDWESLMIGIHAESQYIQQVRLGLDFLGGLAAVRKIPGLLPRLLRRQQCLATAVLSNLGDLTRRYRRRFVIDQDSVVVGNAVLDRVFGTPPIRPHTHASFGLCVCSRQICISMLGNGQVLGDHAPDLLKGLIHQLRLFAKLA